MLLYMYTFGIIWMWTYLKWMGQIFGESQCTQTTWRSLKIRYPFLIQNLLAMLQAQKSSNSFELYKYFLQWKKGRCTHKYKYVFQLFLFINQVISFLSPRIWLLQNLGLVLVRIEASKFILIRRLLSRSLNARYHFP